MYKYWTQQELDYLKENYPKFGARYCANQLKRTFQSCNLKAWKLNITKLQPSNEDNKICSICHTEKPKAAFQIRRYNYCIVCNQARQRKYHESNREKHLIYLRNYQLINKDKLREGRRIYQQRKCKTDISFRLGRYLRSRIRLVLKRSAAVKTNSSLNLIGCSDQYLISYLEAKFQPGMSWDNYGFYGWHVDHIIPCAAFDLTQPTEQAKCFHYTNLQPLWATENLQKNDSLTWQTSPS